MNAGRENLREHPRVGTNRCFIRAIDWDIDDDGRHAVTALRRTTGCESLHVLGKPLDVIRRVFHVVADVVGIDLSVFLSLLETAFRAGMRAGVVDGLPLREQFNRSIDPLRLDGLTNRHGGSQSHHEYNDRNPREKLSHGFLRIFLKNREQYTYNPADHPNK